MPPSPIPAHRTDRPAAALADLDRAARWPGRDIAVPSKHELDAHTRLRRARGITRSVASTVHRARSGVSVAILDRRPKHPGDQQRSAGQRLGTVVTGQLLRVLPAMAAAGPNTTADASQRRRAASSTMTAPNGTIGA